MVIDIREVRPHDKAEWLQLWQGYTRFYGSPQPEEVTEYTWQRMLDVNSSVLGRVAVVDDALLPLTYLPRTGSSNTVTWATHLFWQLLTSFTWPGEQGHYIPREYPFAVA